MEWGSEIRVDGKRPTWLTDDSQMFTFREGERDDTWYGDTPKLVRWVVSEWSSAITAIRLPADHFAYKAIAAGFEPWGGGDAAPDDRDDVEVLLNDGTVFRYGRESIGWTRTDADCVRGLKRAIGYRRKPAIATPGTPTFAKYQEPPLPTYDPATHVAVPLMTKDEALARLDHIRQTTASNPAEPRGLWIYRDLGVVKPDPTPLERFMAEHPDADRDTAALALGWSK